MKVENLDPFEFRVDIWVASCATVVWSIFNFGKEKEGTYAS